MSPRSRLASRRTFSRRSRNSARPQLNPPEDRTLLTSIVDLGSETSFPGSVRVTALRKRCQVRFSPSPERLENRMLLTILTQSSLLDTALQANNPIISYDHSIDQNASEIAPVSDSSGNSATDDGVTGSYAISLQSTVVNSSTGSDSGTVSISSSASFSAAGTYTDLYTDAGFSVSYQIVIMAITNGELIEDYDSSSSSSGTGDTDAGTDGGEGQNYGSGASLLPGIYQQSIQAGSTYYFSLGLFGITSGIPSYAEASSSLSWQFVPDALLIAATTPTWDGSDGGVDYGYTISDADLPEATTVDLDWASGTTVATVIGDPIVSTTTETAQGTYNLTASPSQLGAPPPGANDLLVVVDPDNVISPADPSKLAALALPTIAVMTPTFDTTGGGVEFGYTITGANLPQPTTVALYWASGTTFDTAIGDPIETEPTQTAEGTYTVDVPTSAFGQPPAGTQYLLAVADPDNTITESDDPNNVQVLTLPDIAVTDAAFDAQGGVSFDYTVTGAALYEDTSVAVYWAIGDPSSTSPSDELGDPVYSYDISTAADMAVGDYGPIVVPQSDLTSPPDGATHLIVDADAQDDIIESDPADNAEALATIDLDPLQVEGDFVLNQTSQQYLATGTILIGLAPAPGEAFSPLISINGTVSYDEDTIEANGVINALIGGISAPLLEGTWSIDVGQAITSELDESAQLPNQFQIAGVAFTLSSFDLVDDDDGGQIELQGQLSLPDALGGVTLAVDGDHEVIIDQNGVSFTGGTLSLPDTTIVVGGILDLEADSVTVEYDAADPDTGAPAMFKLQGDVMVPAVYNFQANFSGQNYISIQNGTVNLVGSISGSDIDLPTPGWSFKQIELDFNTVGGTLGGSATLVIPPGVNVSATINFLVGQQGNTVELNNLTLGASNLDEPIGDTGLFLQSITGSVDHIAASDPTPAVFMGSVSMTAGPQIDINLPSWAGGEVSGSLIGLNLNGTIDSSHLSASGSVSVANGLALGASATVMDDWNDDLIEGSGDIKLLGGVVDASASFEADSDLDLTMQGSAMISLGPLFPAPFSLLVSALGSFSGNADLQYSPSLPLTSDFVEAVGTVNLVGFGTTTLGERVDFEGNATPISSLSAVPPEDDSQDTPSADLVVPKTFAEESLASAPASQTFQVDPNTSRLLLTAEWDNVGATSAVEIVAPDGTVYSTANMTTNDPVSVISELSGPGIETVGVLTPIPGAWTIRLPDASSLGNTQFSAYVDSKPASVTINTLTEHASSPQVTVVFDAIEGALPANVSFFYTDQPAAHDGVPIALDGTLSEGSGSVAWNTAGVAPGTYYVYASIDDGADPVTFADAPAPVVIGTAQPTGLSSVSGSGTYGGTATLTARLTAGGSHLEGENVTFALDNGGSMTTVGTATTDMSGVATLSGVSLAGFNAGTADDVITASFAGDSIGTASDGSGDLTINPARATLSLSGLAFDYDGTPHTATVSSSPAVSGVTVAYAQNNLVVAAPTQAGSYAVIATLNNPNYTASDVAGILTINQATPTVSWSMPAGITSGTGLGPAQLDATASVPGNFSYTPAMGTILPSGQGQILWVTFTPTDSTDYASATGSTTINVLTPPQVMTIAPVSSKHRLTSFTVDYSEALNSSSASSSLLYHVFGAVTKIVKKHKETLFTKALAIRGVTPGSSGNTVTIKLRKPYKGEVQVTVRGTITASNGASNSVNFPEIFE